MEKDALIYIAGHRGLVGSALLRKLKNANYKHLIYKTQEELDLKNQVDVQRFFEENRPAYVFLAAAKVGGIQANFTKPAEFIYENLLIQTNVIHYAYQCEVQKLLFFGSSCIYPKLAPQPIREKDLLTGRLEPTNEAYAIAKIAGITMCQSYNRQYGTDFISIMPTNLYGPGDNFDLENSHVLPAMIRKFHDAKVAKLPSVELWGSGSPRREFLYVDDLADAALFLMDHYTGNEPVNVGTGVDLTIKELAAVVKKVVGYEGDVAWNTAMPDGTPRKLLDVRKINKLGWKPKISLERGIRLTYDWFLEQNGISNEFYF